MTKEEKKYKEARIKLWFSTKGFQNYQPMTDVKKYIRINKGIIKKF